VFFFERIFGDLLVTFWTCYLAARAKGAVLTVYGIPRFSDGFTPLPHPGLRDGFQETVSECRQFLGSQVFVTESCLPVNRPHENPEKRP
jgi:hypothetical protein